MRRTLCAVVGAALVVTTPSIASATPRSTPSSAPTTVAPSAAAGAAPAPQGTGRAHDLPNPLADKQRALRRAGLEKVLSGQAAPTGDGKVVEVAEGQFVELAREDTDQIFTVLGEFSDLAHNRIPAPNRAVDNTTIWTKDFSQPYYQDLLFSQAAGDVSMANYYDEVSSGRYTVEGEVTDWVRLPGSGASYGDNDLGDAAAWRFVNDSLNGWYAQQLAAGRTAAQIDQQLSRFDQWDRYDFDGDGNFDEPDGYIDHFQAVHAGEGEEVGGGALGDDAIWSHRWYDQTSRVGTAGPSVDGQTVALGGTRIGQSKYWVGDYTVEPENGGVGVFAHEFGHDLGLPDLYDTSGNSGGAENSTAFWSLMSSGSCGSSGRPEDGIGAEPMHMGAWEKLQLGWLNHETVEPGAKANTKLGPAEANTEQAQALLARLPDKEVTTTADPNGQNHGQGVTGSTGGQWVDLTASLAGVPAGALVGFRYWTDGAATEPGLQVDAVSLGGARVTNWTLDGFTVTATRSSFNAYLAEYRQYRGYDASLATGPYDFGDRARPDWAERYPYQDGLLITYWNSQYADNNVGAHPGGGLILPVDAHPGLLHEPTDDVGSDRGDGESWRPRVQSHDSTFGLQRTDTTTLHDPDTGKAGTYGGLPAVATFDATRDWYVARGEQPDADGWSGVEVPKTGTEITVVSTSARDSFMQVRVS